MLHKMTKKLNVELNRVQDANDKILVLFFSFVSYLGNLKKISLFQ